MHYGLHGLYNRIESKSAIKSWLKSCCLENERIQILHISEIESEKDTETLWLCILNVDCRVCFINIYCCASVEATALIYCLKFSLSSIVSLWRLQTIEMHLDSLSFHFFPIAKSCKWYKFHECTRIAPIFSYAPGAVNILHIRYKERCISSCSTTQPNKMKTGKLVKYFANTQPNSTQSKPKPAHTAP